MSYPTVYREIKRMVKDNLLETEMARAIVRKSGVRPGVSGEGGETTPLIPQEIDLLQEYSKLDHIPGETHSQYGSVVPYTSSASQLFPDGLASMLRFWDFRDVSEMRLIVTVTEAASADSTLELTMYQDTGSGPSYPSPPFTGGAPSVPLDSVGLHITDWKPIEWLSITRPFSDPDMESYGRPALLLPWLLNPSGSSGTFGMGLIQILLRA